MEKNKITILGESADFTVNKSTLKISASDGSMTLIRLDEFPEEWKHPTVDKDYPIGKWEYAFYSDLNDDIHTYTLNEDHTFEYRFERTFSSDPNFLDEKVYGGTWEFDTETNIVTLTYEGGSQGTLFIYSKSSLYCNNRERKFKRK